MEGAEGGLGFAAVTKSFGRLQETRQGVSEPSCLASFFGDEGSKVEGVAEIYGSEL